MTSNAAGSVDPLSVLAKTRLIVEAFDPGDGDLTLSELVARTGLAKATVHRIVSELSDWGLVERTRRGYRLGLHLFELGHRVPLQRTLRDAAVGPMQDLFAVSGQTVHLAVVDGIDVVYLAKLDSRDDPTDVSQVAGRLPLHCTATGKVMLAHAPPAVRRHALAHVLLPRTCHTITDPVRLAAQLTQARANGFAVEREETTMGYVSIAVPVLGRGGTALAALSLTAPVAQTEVLMRTRPALAGAGSAVARALRTTP